LGRKAGDDGAADLAAERTIALTGATAQLLYKMNVVRPEMGTDGRGAA
jgi:hypothetical protein